LVADPDRPRIVPKHIEALQMSLNRRDKFRDSILEIQKQRIIDHEVSELIVIRAIWLLMRQGDGYLKMRVGRQ